MRDFFARQEEARSKSRKLYFLFALAVIAVVFLVYGAAWCGYLWVRTDQLTHEHLPFWHWPLLRWTALPTLMVVLGGSWYKIAELRAGGGARVAELLGAKPLAPDSTDPAERQLLNVVAEMALASGMPVPSVYLLQRDRGINAFAAGFGLDDAVVCVTEGTLLLLTREEQQGVIAHEFSHLLNGDTLVNIRLMGLLHGILLIALGGEILMRTGNEGRRKGGGFILFGLALYLLGSLGLFFGNLIKSAVSRQREYLADAAAVQFTRNPLGLAGALKKIAALGDAGRIGHTQSLAISHMFFCDDRDYPAFAWLATHPPLLERIRLLDSSFDGTLPAVEPLPAPPPPPAYAPRSPQRTATTGAGPATPLNGAQAAAMLAAVGAPQQEHAERARAILANLPSPVLEALHNPSGACAVVYALLLCPDATQREKQLQLLTEDAPAAINDAVGTLAPLLTQLPGQGRLPLVDLALPALRTLSAPQYRLFMATVRKLILADGKTTLFDFALQQILTRQLAAHFGRSAPSMVQIYGLRGVATEAACVLSVLAHAGHRDAEQAAAAFAHGSRLLHEKNLAFELLPLAECPPSRLGQALERLAFASLPLKRRLLAACLDCLAYDGEVAVAEAELFRAVAEALGCPAPPWLLPQPA
jgi:Zn-dependent protease with chaperone function